jgi:hypothetical protein
MTPITPPDFRRRLNWSSVGIISFLVAFWAVALFALTGCRTADAADTLAWGRSYAVADSLVVPVSWKPACNALGCADAYRVTWAIATNGTRTPESRDNTPASAVLRDVTVLVPRDSVRVALPEIGMPRTICIYVVAVRRGLASEARSACRTIESPDAPPPAVDSIRWDSLNIPPVTPPLLDSLHAGLRVMFGVYQYAVASDSLGDLWVDSLPLAKAAGADSLTLGYATVTCGVVFLTSDSTPLVVVPLNGYPTTAQLGRYKDRCGASVSVAYATKPPVRFFADSITFRSETVRAVPAKPADKGA